MKLFFRKLRLSLFSRFVIKKTTAGIAHPYYVRFWSTDEQCEREILGKNVSRYSAADFPAMLPDHPYWIIDAGANIGMRTIQFANLFPNAKIIAIEPEGGNFQLLRRNTAPYPNIICLQAGLWKSETYLKIDTSPVAFWSFRVEELAAADNSCIRGVSIESLMRDYNIARIAILKADIEGSEKEVFEHCSAWIDKVDSFLVEFHERFRPGCADGFYQNVGVAEFEFLQRDENIFARRKRS